MEKDEVLYSGRQLVMVIVLNPSTYRDAESL